MTKYLFWSFYTFGRLHNALDDYEMEPRLHAQYDHSQVKTVENIKASCLLVLKIL